MKKTNDILVYFTMSLVLLIKSFAFIFLFKNAISTYIFTLTNIYIYISFILLVTSFYFLMKSKHRTWYLFSIDVIITIILFGDLVFYNGFSSFLSLFHLKELASVSEAKSGIGSLINLKYFTLFIDIIVLIPIMIAISKRNSPVKRSPILFVILILVALNCFTDKNRLSKLQHLRYMQGDTMITQSPIGYHVYDIYSFIKSKNRTISKKEIQTVSDWIKVNKEELPNNEYSGLFKGKNLLTVQFESLEQFVINEKADGQEITPNLNKLLKNGLYFNNYHQIINEGSSSDAEFATNTSLYPLRKGAVAYVYPNLKYNTLPTILNNNGYETSIYHPDKKIFWNWGEVNKSLGFKNLYSEPDYKCNEYTPMGISDGCFLNKVSDFIVKQKQPFYSLAVMGTSHIPFKLAKSFQELKLDKSLQNTILGDYFQAVHYSDKQLGLMLDKLDKKGLLDNTVVAVYGDHMGVHKYYANKVSKIKDIKPEWKKVTYKVPLIIYQKNYAHAKTMNILGNETDFLPTICYLLGIDDKYYKGYAMGKVLVNTNKNYTLLNNGTILSDKPIGDNEKEHTLESFTVSETIIKINNPHK